MKFKIEGNSTLEINDDNSTVVSQDIQRVIQDGFKQPDNEKEKKPELTIKD